MRFYWKLVIKSFLIRCQGWSAIWYGAIFDSKVNHCTTEVMRFKLHCFKVYRYQINKFRLWLPGILIENGEEKKCRFNLKYSINVNRLWYTLHIFNTLWNNLIHDFEFNEKHIYLSHFTVHHHRTSFNRAHSISAYFERSTRLELLEIDR